MALIGNEIVDCVALHREDGKLNVHLLWHIDVDGTLSNSEEVIALQARAVEDGLLSRTASDSADKNGIASAFNN